MFQPIFDQSCHKLSAHSTERATTKIEGTRPNAPFSSSICFWMLSAAVKVLESWKNCVDSAPLAPSASPFRAPVEESRTRRPDMPSPSVKESALPSLADPVYPIVAWKEGGCGRACHAHAHVCVCILVSVRPWIARRKGL